LSFLPCLLVTDSGFAAEMVFPVIFLPKEERYNGSGLIDGGFLMAPFFILAVRVW
jgi:hypothetical protein